MSKVSRPHSHYHAVVTTIARKYDLPGLFYLDLWPLGPEQLIIIDPELASQYVTPRNLPKHKLQADFLDPILGEGNIVVANGPRWKRLHNMLAPAFSTTNVLGMTRLFAQNVKGFHDVLSEISKSGEPFSLEEKISTLVFDIIFKAIFDTSSNAGTESHDDRKELHAVVRAEMSARRTWNPIKKRSLIRERETAAKKLSDSIASRVRDRFTTLQKRKIDLSTKRGLGILDLILRERIQEAKEKDTSPELDSDFVEMAVANIKSLLLAGSGTTTDTLCFAFMLLSTYPDVVEKLRQEHRRVHSSDVNETLSMLEEDPRKLKDLEFTTNVIKETLRIYPIGPTGRAPDVPDFISYKGKKYPTFSHTIICPVQHTWHMDPRVFQDPDTFNPDRFTEMDKSTQLAWRPFERGTRQCIGQSLAMEEMKMVLLLTVQYFDFKCYGLKPNPTPRVSWTSMDLVFGDRAFQEFLAEAKPRDGMPMIVTRAEGA